jgi:hypothetical protein
MAGRLHLGESAGREAHGTMAEEVSREDHIPGPPTRTDPDAILMM